MPLPTAYDITIKIETYLKNGGTEKAIADALGFKTTERVRKLIDGQLWETKHLKKLVKKRIIVATQRKVPRTLLHDAEEITRQVVSWMDELGHLPKFCLLMGWRSPKTYNNRVTLHNWTKQELSVLIIKRIVDDSFST